MAPFLAAFSKIQKIVKNREFNQIKKIFSKKYSTKHAYLFTTKKILGVRCTLTFESLFVNVTKLIALLSRKESQEVSVKFLLWSRSSVKIGRWSDTSQNISPLTDMLLKLLVQILSISIAVLEIILVGRVINGKKHSWIHNY